MSKNPKNWGKLMKIANIDREILHNFWTTWGISMKFSGKMCFMIILKVTKNQGFTLSSEDTFFKKPQGGGGQTLFKCRVFSGSSTGRYGPEKSPYLVTFHAVNVSRFR